MATLEEVLGEDSGHYLLDTIQFTIDENLRTISIPKDGVVAGVVNDNETNRINFKMNRNYNGLDMSEFQPYIVYVNAVSEANYYTVDDVTVTDDYLLFSWLVRSDVTKESGNVGFVVKMVKGDSIFSTTLGTVKVLNGLDIEDYATPEIQYSLVQSMQASLDEYAVSIIPGLVEEHLSETSREFKTGINNFLNMKREEIRNWFPEEDQDMWDVVNNHTIDIASSLKLIDYTLNDANDQNETGILKSAKDVTTNVPEEVIGTDSQWGLLMFLVENPAYGTGTQMYFPIDGDYKGQVFTRNCVDMNSDNKKPGEWHRLATIDDFKEISYLRGYSEGLADTVYNSIFWTNGKGLSMTASLLGPEDAVGDRQLMQSSGFALDFNELRYYSSDAVEGSSYKDWGVKITSEEIILGSSYVEYDGGIKVEFSGSTFKYLSQITNEIGGEFRIDMPSKAYLGHMYFKPYAIIEGTDVTNVKSMLLGNASYPFDTVYLNSAPSVVSDERKKKDIEDLDTNYAKSIILGLEPKTFKYKNNESDRTHFGFVAQDVETLINKLGIDSKDFAPFIKSPREDGDFDYSLRYEELIAEIISVLQSQQKEIDELKRLLNT